MKTTLVLVESQQRNKCCSLEGSNKNFFIKIDVYVPSINLPWRATNFDMWLVGNSGIVLRVYKIERLKKK